MPWSTSSDPLCLSDRPVPGSWQQLLQHLDDGNIPTCCHPTDSRSWCRRPALGARSADVIHPIEGKGCAVGRCLGYMERFEFKSEGCVLPKWDARAFCEALGSRRILFIGDSTMQQHAASVAHAVRWGSAQGFTQGDGASCAARLLAGVSDTLLGRPRFGANNRGHAWDAIVRASGLQTAGPHADIIVLAAGAHIYGEANFSFVLEQVASARERLLPHVHLIWQTGPSAGCGPKPLAAAPNASFWARQRAA